MLLAKDLQELLDIHVNKEDEPFPVRLNYFMATDKVGNLNATYENTDGFLVRRSIETGKFPDKEWTINLASTHILDIQKISKQEKLDLKFQPKSGSISISGDKTHLSLTPWKSDKVLSELDSFDDPAVVLHFDQEGFNALYSSALIAGENPKNAKKQKRGIQVSYDGSLVMMTSLNDYTICYRSYTQPIKKGRGRPKKDSSEIKEGEFILPCEAVLLFHKAGEEAVSISVSKGKALLEGKRISIAAHLIDSEGKKFPTLEQFNPKATPETQFEREKLMKAISSLIGDELKEVPIKIIFQNSSLTLHVNDESKKDITIPAADKPKEPLQASIVVAGKALLNVLKYLTAAKIALTFPGAVSERLIIEALGASYLLSATLVEAVKFAKTKVTQMTSPAPAAENVKEEVQSDGSTVTVDKVETPAPEIGPEPKPETPQETKKELEKQLEKAKEIASKAKKAAEAEPPEQKEFIAKAQEIHKNLMEEAVKGLKEGEKLDLLLSSLFWANSRLYSWTVTKTSWFRLRINIDIVED